MGYQMSQVTSRTSTVAMSAFKDSGKTNASVRELESIQNTKINGEENFEIMRDYMDDVVETSKCPFAGLQDMMSQK